MIRGVLYQMTINPPHAVATGLSYAVLISTFRAGWWVRQKSPFDLGRRTLLEPDFAVVAGSIRDFSRSHPKFANLIVEISNSTLGKDRKIKAHLYAQAGIADYWIVNLVDRQLEVHRKPGPDPDRRGRFRYAEVTTVAESGSMAPLASPGTPIGVGDLLP